MHDMIALPYEKEFLISEVSDNIFGQGNFQQNKIIALQEIGGETNGFSPDQVSAVEMRFDPTTRCCELDAPPKGTYTINILLATKTAMHPFD